LAKGSRHLTLGQGSAAATPRPLYEWGERLFANAVSM